MKLTPIAILLCVLISSFVWADTDEIKPFAVVELFTSEGCSSCPPADKVLTDLTKTAKDNGFNIMTLGFHVDYWNGLGWPDRFSHPKYSQYQNDYVRATNARTKYTPQMIVNGQTQFVGSNGVKALNAIEYFLNQEPQVVLDVDQLAIDDAFLSFICGFSKDIQNATLNVAIVEDDLSTQIKRGENAGLDITHSNVVRTLEQYEAEMDEVLYEIDLPDPLDTSKSTLIVYLQDNRTRQILGATQRPLP